MGGKHGSRTVDMISGNLTNLMAFITGIATLFSSAFGILERAPDAPEFALTLEEELERFTNGTPDMSQFRLTFEDNFDGDALDKSVWSGHYSPFGGPPLVRKGGYWSADLARVEDGKLILPLQYMAEGKDGGGPGWYSVGLDTDGEGSSAGFRQTYGYFEVRCILPACAHGWAAFWLSNDDVAHIGNYGRDGTEIDIFESPYYGTEDSGRISVNLHYDGYGKYLRSLKARRFPVEGDPYSEFNTYSLEWNENEYIFYINRAEVYRCNFGGVSRSPEYLLLSVELSGKNGVFSYDSLDKDREYDFIVDYVRAYQYKDRAAGN